VRTIGEEWEAWLPPTKAEAFAAAKSVLCADSAMLEVALNEGVGLSRRGSPAPCCEFAQICTDLFERLAVRLEAALRTLHRNAQNSGILPNVSPLCSGFFRSEAARSQAKRSRFFSHILSSSSQLSLKLDDLVIIVGDLVAEFRPLAGELGLDRAADPEASWDRLELLDYDLKTCLAEMLVVLKSFLHVLPDEETLHFRRQMEAAVRTSSRLSAIASLTGEELTLPGPAKAEPARPRRARNSST
jgi:hypothetical protein